ncbi:3-isopropylmalate/(R)-2-methylmalate dehydratase small subunit [Thermosporothrix hazakensis]|jgi:3-isopropylmalate/(R)-2-methylmalate dehydratase small subunit|uniref:3-isopropylmalate dehydratase small subunit n=2 Tax=Thermosporothrix TaxID=768650 RepID=A0A326U398_THEHA|nr:3-isopropylmalate dehydratase small subunit [Thermosporothrix hazakensis]PZW26399.1 3-isopropylmalate/(R)-2-methylmalate dehydratase small subunit [Thermosporothrix hazakensis]BBH90599.1 3-isopropylmalate dehydratase small subunit [Thermosporothrix sp. COM3]GCE48650.1 3-isopropylmalate dehydratase small subunit [Thermosporothrix hazakensis]
MEPFITHTGLVAPLDRTDVNTDEITPARFLKTVRRTGFADALFANFRYIGDTREPDPDFVLNKPRYQGASILLSGKNFGCGSSREHAPWAIREYGFRVIITPGFADIFYNNCFNNGILPVVLPEATVLQLFREVEANEGYQLTVDLEAQTVVKPDGTVLHFDIDAFKKDAMLKGLDNIGWTLSHADEIAAYEQRRRQDAPWLFDITTSA